MLISDNAKTFQSASKEIPALSRSHDVLGHLANNVTALLGPSSWNGLHGAVVSGRANETMSKKECWSIYADVGGIEYCSN